MVNARKCKRKASFTIAMIQILLLFHSVGVATPAIYAQSAPGYLRLVRFLEADQVAIQDPVGLLFVDAADSLLVLEENTATVARTAQSQVTAITTYEKLLGTVALPQVVDPRTVAYDIKGKRLLFFDATNRQLLQYTIQANGLPAIANVNKLALPTGTDTIDGMAIGADGQSLYLLESDSLRIHKLDLTADQLQASATSAIDLRRLGLSQARGLALHPQSGNLFTLDPTTQRLYELTTSGLLLTHYELAEAEIQDVQGFTFAPSGDLSDDPAEISLYVTDRLPSAQGQNQPTNPNLRPAAYLPLVVNPQTANSQSAQTLGRIAEITFEPLASAAQTAVNTDVATLVRTVKTFEWSPPSPDPSDIAYISSTPYLLTGNRLLISDGEVDEMPIYAGANLYETTLEGALQATYTTLQVGSLPRLTREPVGMSFNPNNGHLFITDDDGTQPLIEIDPGPDKIYRTADDTVTSFSISAAYGYNNPKYIDAEGVEYAKIGGEEYLFFADGLNSDVHIVKPGPNGKFDGVDDQVTHFDTDALGVGDPEGIAYSPTSGTLYLAGFPATRIAETTIDGTLLRYVDYSAAKAKKPAGLTFAPGSLNPSQWNLYIVDRNVDNNSDPKENDGYLYEIAIPAAGNQAPIVDAGLNLTVTLPATANLNATVTDDGQPDPPAAVTVTWSKVSGPGSVTFDNANNIDTTASFSLPGDYVLRLTASDGQVSNSDTVNVKVLVINQPPTINAGVDQIIEVGTMATLSAQVSDDGWPSPPNKVTTTWQKVSGPGTVSFTNPNSAATTAGFSAVGDYVLRATANDSQLEASDEVIIHVLPPNTAPQVNAGVDQLIGRNDTLKLVGVVTDDGLPNPPRQVTVTWSKVSGPGSVAFTPTNQLTTTVTFTAFGVYVLRLTANDGALSAFDEVTVTVAAPNQPPVVNAGVDQTIRLTETATLAGSVSDDGIPNPPGAIAVTWQLQSGPGNAIFSDAHALTTTVHFTAAGSYTLNLIASDGSQEANDTVIVTVIDPDVGTIVLGQSETTDVGKVITLTATISGAWATLPPGALTYAWSRASGPGLVTLGTPNDLTTTATFTTPGEYLLQLVVANGTEVITGTVVVVVNAINQAPQVSAGADQSIAQPGVIQLTATVTDDGLPSSPGKVTVQWTRISGPAEVVFANSTSATTTASFTVAGTYVLKVTATDSRLSSEDTLTVQVGSGGASRLFLPIVKK